MRPPRLPQNYMQSVHFKFLMPRQPYYAEEFENGVFTQKMHQMFSVHTMPEKFENAAITGHFGIVFEENPSRETT